LQKIAANLINPAGDKKSAYYIYLSPAENVAGALPIWPELAPGETSMQTGTALPSKGEVPAISRIRNVRCPQLDVYLAPKPNGASVVVLPGGGFRYVVPNLEGSEAAAILNKAGFSAFVLRYRTKLDKNDPGWPRALQDAQRAMKFVRSKAKKWNLDPKKIGLLGFSAGGQVAARLLTDNGELSYPPVDSIDENSHRPDFAMLVYPWKIYDSKLNGLLPEIKVAAGGPPTFIVHTHDDSSSSLGSVMFYVGLKKAGIDAELHVYQNGGHGYGVRPRPNSNIGSWPDRMLDWLKKTVVPTTGRD
jgi:acetyl esterase/lipase